MTGEIDFAAPHTLSLTWFPRWLLEIERTFGTVRSRLLAANVHDAVVQLVEGGCDLLLCYHHPKQPVQLDAKRYDMLLLGHERIAPYARCDRAGKPDFTLPGTPAAPAPYLAYGQNAYLGRMVGQPGQVHAETVSGDENVALARLPGSPGSTRNPIARRVEMDEATRIEHKLLGERSVPATVYGASIRFAPSRTFAWPAR